MSQNLYVSTITGILYTIDCATGNPVRIGPMGPTFISDIAFHNCEGMYAIDFANFYKVDIRTGAATLVGPLGVTSQVNALEVGADGTVYAAAGMTGDFFTIDASTGSATLVGNYGGGLYSPGDIAFDSSGVLYASVNDTAGTGYLATINPATGAATIIGPMGINDVWGLDFYCCHLFGVTSNGFLVTIDPLTGAATFIGRTGLPAGGMSARPCSGC